jgi:hypothetical protein
MMGTMNASRRGFFGTIAAAIAAVGTREQPLAAPALSAKPQASFEKYNRFVHTWLNENGDVVIENISDEVLYISPQGLQWTVDEIDLIRNQGPRLSIVFNTVKKSASE